jgi:hypothetical protein
MERKYEAARDAGLLDEPRFSNFRHISSAVDEHGKKSYSVGYGLTQFVWGAYIETASLMCFTLINLATRPHIVEQVRAETHSAVLGERNSLSNSLKVHTHTHTHK